MKNITTYIFEKLHINKDTKGFVKKCHIPTEKDYDNIDNILKNCSKNNFREFNDLAEECTDRDKSIRLWVATMLKTGSIPRIFKDSICSWPGNFGKELIDNAINLGADKTDIFYIYDLQKETKCEINDNVIDYFNSAISTILDKILPSDNYMTLLKYDDINNYSDNGRDLNNKRNGIITIPFEIIYNKKTVNAEFSFLGYTYYNFRLKDKNYKWSVDFADALKKEFNI